MVMNKKIIISTLALLIILSSFAFAVGVTYPIPPELQLRAGESGRVRWAIQADASESVCSFQIIEQTILGSSVMDVQFDEEKTELNPNTLKYVFATVTAPVDAVDGDYVTTFCTVCSPKTKGAGSPIVFKTCGLPIKVKVGDVITRENMKVEVEPEEEVPEAPAVPSYLYIIVIIVVLIMIMWWYHSEKKKGKNFNRRKAF